MSLLLWVFWLECHPVCSDSNDGGVMLLVLMLMMLLKLLLTLF